MDDLVLKGRERCGGLQAAGGEGLVFWCFGEILSESRKAKRRFKFG